MVHIKKALLYGFLVWIIPFGVASVIFQVKASNRSLFESILTVTLVACVSVLGTKYLRKVNENIVREGVILGILWMAVSIVIDLPIFLGPIQMPIREYLYDIAITYLVIPVITVSLAFVAKGSNKDAGMHRPQQTV